MGRVHPNLHLANRFTSAVLGQLKDKEGKILQFLVQLKLKFFFWASVSQASTCQLTKYTGLSVSFSLSLISSDICWQGSFFDVPGRRSKRRITVSVLGLHGVHRGLSKAKQGDHWAAHPPNELILADPFKSIPLSFMVV